MWTLIEKRLEGKYTHKMKIVVPGRRMGDFLPPLFSKISFTL